MKFSICIPCYNAEKTIEKTILSAINQNFEDYNIIVSDNGSTDSTVEILNKFKDKIQVISESHTPSSWENHNRCLVNSSSDYIVFCHSDDHLKSDALHKYDNILNLRGNPNKYVLWGRSYYRDFKVHWDKSGINLDQTLSGIDLFKVFINSGLTPSGTCYSRKSFADLNGFYSLEHLIPSDMVSYWKLILDHFEFEMSSRIFFIRNLASSAVEKNFLLENQIRAIDNAYREAFSDNPEYKRFIRQLFKKGSDQLISDICLINNEVLEKSEVIKRVFKNTLKKPSKKNFSRLYKYYKWT